MRDWLLAAVDDQALPHQLKQAVARESAAVAEVIAHIGAMDARRLYLSAGYPSMVQYCVFELLLSERTARKRIGAARAGREFPLLFEALAKGSLNLSGVLLLAPHLTAENAGDLVDSAAGRTNEEIERLVAARFPRTEPIPWVQPLRVDAPEARNEMPDAVERPARGVSFDTAEPAVAPIAPQGYALQFAIPEETHVLLRKAQELASHRIHNGDVAEVFHLALVELVAKLEKQRFAATEAPRASAGSATGRYVPAEVKRRVWERDGGQCTFVSDDGHRCPSRHAIEFDHVLPFALGGRATMANLRLRCRSHNQYAAARELGEDFMNAKREESRRRVVERRAVAAREWLAKREAEAETVTPYLRKLGFDADEVRRGTRFAETVPDLPLEEQLRGAIRCLRPEHPSANRSRERGEANVSRVG